MEPLTDLKINFNGKKGHLIFCAERIEKTEEWRKKWRLIFYGEGREDEEESKEVGCCTVAQTET